MATGGNVGIGTGTPRAKLEVNGSLKAADLEVSGAVTLRGPVLTINNPQLPPSGVNAVDLVMDPETGRIYRQN